MLFSIFDVLRIFEALQILFYKFLLKWGKIEEDFESSIFLESQKYYFAFESRLICCCFFWNGHIRNVVSTLSNIVQFNVEIHNLLNVVDFNVDVHNVVWALIWRCATSRRHINLKATLNQRWNVFWIISWWKYKGCIFQTGIGILELYFIGCHSLRKLSCYKQYERVCFL